MATLPNVARRPIPLDSLLARHARPATAPKPSPRYSPGGPAPASLADLERRASLAPSEASAPPPVAPPLVFNAPGELNGLPLRDAPLALVLCLTRATCACGRVYTSPNRQVLVRYDRAGLSNSVHYSRASIERSVVLDFASLPRERKVIDVAVEFCDECF